MTITVSGNRDFQIRGLAFLAFVEWLSASWPIRSRMLDLFIAVSSTNLVTLGSQ